MTMPTFTMRQLLEAGVHFGHHTRRWNPKMRPYIFMERNGVHIIDLQQTLGLLENAAQIGQVEGYQSAFQIAVVFMIIGALFALTVLKSVKGEKQQTVTANLH